MSRSRRDGDGGAEGDDVSADRRVAGVAGLLVHADQLALLLLEGRPALAKPLAGAAPYSPGVAELARWRLRKLGAWFP